MKQLFSLFGRIYEKAVPQGVRKENNIFEYDVHYKGKFKYRLLGTFSTQLLLIFVID